jgi:hypothetical protein
MDQLALRVSRDDQPRDENFFSVKFTPKPNSSAIQFMSLAARMTAMFTQALRQGPLGLDNVVPADGSHAPGSRLSMIQKKLAPQDAGRPRAVAGGGSTWNLQQLDADDPSPTRGRGRSRSNLEPRAPALAPPQGRVLELPAVSVREMTIMVQAVADMMADKKAPFSVQQQRRGYLAEEGLVTELCHMVLALLTRLMDSAVNPDMRARVLTLKRYSDVLRLLTITNAFLQTVRPNTTCTEKNCLLDAGVTNAVSA